LSGAATEKFPQRDTAVRDLAFNYRLTSEITPLPTPVVSNSVYNASLQANLHEVRLLFRWPVTPRGGVGPVGREVFRTLVGGRHQAVADTNQVLYFFQPTIYRKS
jgi:hypothetical protein